MFFLQQFQIKKRLFLMYSPYGAWRFQNCQVQPAKYVTSELSHNHAIFGNICFWCMESECPKNVTLNNNSMIKQLTGCHCYVLVGRVCDNIHIEHDSLKGRHQNSLPLTTNFCRRFTKLNWHSAYMLHSNPIPPTDGTNGLL